MDRLASSCRKCSARSRLKVFRLARLRYIPLLFVLSCRVTFAMPGDVAPRGNPDGQLNTADLQVLQNIALGLSTPTLSEVIGGDVAPLGNPDCRIDVADIHVLKRAIAGLVTLPVTTPCQKRNILVIIADDLGVDKVGVYGEGGDIPPTPNIDALANSGVIFRNASSNPVCSPTRATIQTGRYGFRTGVTFVVNSPFLLPDGDELPLGEVTIPEALDLNPQLGYQHAAIGKWHLTYPDTPNQGTNCDDPIDAGYNYYSGAFSNFITLGFFPPDSWPTYPCTTATNTQGDTYYNWHRTIAESGSTSALTVPIQTYATTVNVNDTISWIKTLDSEDPWFVWLAFNAPHDPFHAPPNHLHTNQTLKDLLVSEGLQPEDAVCPQGKTSACYNAMVEAMDTEIGRLLASLPPADKARTTVIFIGDNGTPREASADISTPPVPFQKDHAKGSLYEGGVNVPLIISGPDVVDTGRESEALVNTTDLFSTILELAGVNVSQSLAGIDLDSFSLLPVLSNSTNSLRPFTFSEQDTHGAASGRTRFQNGEAIRDEKYKLIHFTPPPPNNAKEYEFYDLDIDPFERQNLLPNGTIAECIAVTNCNNLLNSLNSL